MMTPFFWFYCYLAVLCGYVFAAHVLPILDSDNYISRMRQTRRDDCMWNDLDVGKKHSSRFGLIKPGSLEKYFSDYPREFLSQKLRLYLRKLCMTIYRYLFKFIAVILLSLVIPPSSCNSVVCTVIQNIETHLTC